MEEVVSRAHERVTNAPKCAILFWCLIEIPLHEITFAIFQ